MNDSQTSRTPAARTDRSHDTAVIVRFVLITAIVVALVLVALDNRDHVRVGYVIGHKQGPIWVMMVISAVAGAIIGWLLKHRPRHHR